MPRESPYSIELSDYEARELEWRIDTYTLPYCDVMRAKMIILAASGLRNNEIAKRLGCSRETVSRWRKRFYTEGLAGLDDRHRTGRPRVETTVAT